MADYSGAYSTPLGDAQAEIGRLRAQVARLQQEKVDEKLKEKGYARITDETFYSHKCGAVVWDCTLHSAHCKSA